MNLLRVFQARGSAPVARERLQILLAHERARLGPEADLLARLRDDLVATILRHVDIDPGNQTASVTLPARQEPTFFAGALHSNAPSVTRSASLNPTNC